VYALTATNFSAIALESDHESVWFSSSTEHVLAFIFLHWCFHALDVQNDPSIHNETHGSSGGCFYIVRGRVLCQHCAFEPPFWPIFYLLSRGRDFSTHCCFGHWRKLIRLLCSRCVYSSQIPGASYAWSFLLQQVHWKAMTKENVTISRKLVDQWRTWEKNLCTSSPLSHSMRGLMWTISEPLHTFVLFQRIDLDCCSPSFIHWQRTHLHEIRCAKLQINISTY